MQLSHAFHHLPSFPLQISSHHVPPVVVVMSSFPFIVIASVPCRLHSLPLSSLPPISSPLLPIVVVICLPSLVLSLYWSPLTLVLHYIPSIPLSSSLFLSIFVI